MKSAFAALVACTGSRRLCYTRQHVCLRAAGSHRRDVHAALASGELTCAQLTQLYLDRIEAYNLKGPALRAILTVNPRALETAAEMDRALQGQRGKRGPAALHSDHPQGQLQHRRHADHRRQRQHEGFDSAARRVHGRAHAQGRRADPRESEPAGIRARRHVDQQSRRAGAQPVRSHAHAGRIERRHGRGDRVQHGGARNRQRYRPVDPLAGFGEQPRRHTARRAGWSAARA